MPTESVPVSSSLSVGFRTYGAGALPSTWSFVQGATPGDVAVAASGGGNVALTPAPFLGTQPIFYFTGKSNVTDDFILRASLRAPSEPGFAGVYQASVQLRATTTTYIAIAVQRTTNDTVGVLRISGNAITAVSLTAPVVANQYHRVAIQKIGDVVRFYWNPTGSADPDSVLDDSLLELLYTSACSAIPSAINVAAFLVVQTPSATNYAAIADVSIEDVTYNYASQPFGSGLLARGTGSYKVYKGMRQVSETMNNLVLGL